MILGVVCARASSEGLPGKNVRPFCGKPLIEWAIEKAQTSQYIDEVCVNTDIPSDQYNGVGTHRINRPAELAGPLVSKWAVWQHTLEHYEARGKDVELLVDIDVTRPLTTVEDVDAVIKDDRRWYGVPHLVSLAVVPAKKHPAFDIYEADDEGYLTPFSYGFLSHPVVARQQLEEFPMYYHGGVCAAPRVPLSDRREMWGAGVCAVEIPADHAWDIDDETDWKICEMLMKERLNDE